MTLYEKYRPQTLDEIIGQDHVIHRLKKYVERKDIPHMMFSGEPGTGKTCAAIATARQLYGPEDWSNNFREKNASDERGIDIVRGPIKEYCRQAPTGEISFKLLFLDEADQLTPDAQDALRRPMEKYHAITRFILSCNHPTKISQAIQSRVAIFHFRPLAVMDIKKLLIIVVQKEGIDISTPAIHQVASLSNGSMRMAYNLLEQLMVLEKRITEADIEELSPILDFNIAKHIISKCFHNDMKKAQELFFKLYTIEGYTIDEILLKLKMVIDDSDNLTTKQKFQLLTILGEAEFRIISGSNPYIQIGCMFGKISELSNEV